MTNVTNQTVFKISELTHGLDVTLQGDTHCLIEGVCSIEESKPGHLTFLTSATYKKHLMQTEASAVILPEEFLADCPAHLNVIISRNPSYTYAQVARFFDDKPKKSAGIHASAVIGEQCDIHPTASIGANCVIGDHVTIAANVVIGAGSIIGDHSRIDEDSHLDARVTLYHHITIGKRAHISSGVVIGSDGFGLANQKGAWHKIPQLGSVEIGDDVEIGANTTIDRGAIGNTVIEEGAKLDNLIQVAHNVRIGAHTAIAGCVAIAGSTIIGKYCMIGGATCFAGHLTVCDRAIITGMTAVTKSIREPGMYSSGIVGAVPNHEFLKNNARFHRLEQLMQRVKNLESTIKDLTET